MSVAEIVPTSQYMHWFQRLNTTNNTLLKQIQWCVSSKMWTLLTLRPVPSIRTIGTRYEKIKSAQSMNGFGTLQCLRFSCSNIPWFSSFKHCSGKQYHNVVEHANTLSNIASQCIATILKDTITGVNHFWTACHTHKNHRWWTFIRYLPSCMFFTSRYLCWEIGTVHVSQIVLVDCDVREGKHVHTGVKTPKTSSSKYFESVAEPDFNFWILLWNDIESRHANHWSLPVNEYCWPFLEKMLMHVPG